jgi:hypothetical protein
MAPLIASCSAAALEGGENPIEDFLCFEDIVDHIGNPVCLLAAKSDEKYTDSSLA